MKKACIVTWYQYSNFGSVLQAYALSRYLENEHEGDVSFLNYYPNPQFPKGFVERNFKRGNMLREIKKLIFKKKYGLHQDLINKKTFFM